MPPSSSPIRLARAARWRLIERVAWTSGVLLLIAAGGLYLTGVVSARNDVEAFMAAADHPGTVTAATPDQSLWSPKRVLAWKESLRREAAPALAVLRIDRIRVEVPVLEGTDEWTLNRGVGHIAGTASPGAAGNVGIAGHRDGFFRGLKDITAGDGLELQLHDGVERYTVERIWIVAPDDVSVLDPTPSRAVTLVTCYPFYFVGSAPQRFIVRAVPAPSQGG